MQLIIQTQKMAPENLFLLNFKNVTLKFYVYTYLEKKKYPPITYEYAQEEIAAKAGVKVDSAQGGDMALLQVHTFFFRETRNNCP